jgi:hypothetical protein
MDLGESEHQRRLLRFFASYVEIGRAVVAPRRKSRTSS